MNYRKFLYCAILANLIVHGIGVYATEPVDVFDGDGSSGFSYYGTSPDRNWYVGETANYRNSPIRLALYRRGSTEPVAILMEHSFEEMTWQKRAHVNPSFSRDGKRVYFFRAVSPNRFKASYVDISKLIANNQTFRKR